MSIKQFETLVSKLKQDKKLYPLEKGSEPFPFSLPTLKYDKKKNTFFDCFFKKQISDLFLTLPRTYKNGGELIIFGGIINRIYFDNFECQNIYDIDLVFIGMKKLEIIEAINEIENELKFRISERSCSGYTYNLYIKNSPIKIQFVLSENESINELFSFIDVPCTQICIRKFKHNRTTLDSLIESNILGKNLMLKYLDINLSALAKFSWKHKINWIDYDTYSIASEYRFQKYLRQGWILVLPNLNIRKIFYLPLLRNFDIVSINGWKILLTISYELARKHLYSDEPDEPDEIKHDYLIIDNFKNTSGSFYPASFDKDKLYSLSYTDEPKPLCKKEANCICTNKYLSVFFELVDSKIISYDELITFSRPFLGNFQQTFRRILESNNKGNKIKFINNVYDILSYIQMREIDEPYIPYMEDMYLTYIKYPYKSIIIRDFNFQFSKLIILYLFLNFKLKFNKNIVYNDSKSKILYYIISFRFLNIGKLYSDKLCNSKFRQIKGHDSLLPLLNKWKKYIHILRKINALELREQIINLSADWVYFPFIDEFYDLIKLYFEDLCMSLN